MMQTITSMHNPKVALWRGLKNRAARQAAGLYLVEGVKMVEEAMRMGLVQTLLVDMERITAFGSVTAQAACEAYSVSPHILAAICDTKTPQGIVALVNLPDLPTLDVLGPLIVALDGVQDPGNVGTILRTADAAGFTGALLSEECADLYSPKCLRATMGSIFRMKALVCANLAQSLDRLKNKGFHVISGELNGTPFYSREALGNQLCLVIGSEGNGVCKEVSNVCTHRLTLPMGGGAESLNAAVAAGIMMYDLIHRN